MARGRTLEANLMATDAGGARRRRGRIGPQVTTRVPQHPAPLVFWGTPLLYQSRRANNLVSSATDCEGSQLWPSSHTNRSDTTATASATNFFAPVVNKSEYIYTRWHLFSTKAKLSGKETYRYARFYVAYREEPFRMQHSNKYEMACRAVYKISQGRSHSLSTLEAHP